MTPDTQPPQTTHATAARFRAAFGRAPEWIGEAPGRVNLIGEHIDYLGGRVFPIAIERGTRVAVAPNNAGLWRFRAAEFEAAFELPASVQQIEPLPGGVWVNYPLGVMKELQAIEPAREALARGWDFWVEGDMPVGAGLSSSASIEVATAAALGAALELELAPVELARIAWRAEREFVGVPCGFMDQAASAMCLAGHALALDCSTAEPTWRHAPIPAGAAFIVMHSGVSRALAGSEYARRQSECAEALRLINGKTGLAYERLLDATPEALKAAFEGAGEEELIALRRARHALSENRRVDQFRKALAKNDLPRAGALMNESHISLRDDYAVSCPELDDLTSLARLLPGVLGARLTGAGFGGCAIALVRADEGERALSALRERFYEPRGLNAPVFLTRASNGAQARRP